MSSSAPPSGVPSFPLTRVLYQVIDPSSSTEYIPSSYPGLVYYQYDDTELPPEVSSHLNNSLSPSLIVDVSLSLPSYSPIVDSIFPSPHFDIHHSELIQLDNENQLRVELHLTDYGRKNNKLHDQNERSKRQKNQTQSVRENKAVKHKKAQDSSAEPVSESLISSVSALESHFLTSFTRSLDAHLSSYSVEFHRLLAEMREEQIEKFKQQMKIIKSQNNQ